MATKSPKRGRPVDEGKRDHILSIATKLFMKQGFNATTMDQIAAAAAMSKLTLYKRFPDKHALFAEAIMEKCRKHFPDTFFEIFETKTPREAIHTFGTHLFELIMSSDAICIYRMMIAEGIENPKLTEMFYNAGPQRTRGILHEKMKHFNESGMLKIADVEAATDVLLSLFKGTALHQRLLLNIGKKPSKKEVTEHIERATEVFMRAYAK